jgi:hypothetical protein
MIYAPVVAVGADTGSTKNNNALSMEVYSQWTYSRLTDVLAVGAEVGKSIT